MVKFKTENCKRFGQQEIVLTLDDEAQMEPRWILDYFQAAAAAGGRFRTGETVQIGWMVTKLVETASRLHFQICEGIVREAGGFVVWR